MASMVAPLRGRNRNVAVLQRRLSRVRPIVHAMLTAIVLASSMAGVPDVLPTLDRSPRVIVEFTATPAAYAAKSAASFRAQTLARFRADLHAAAPAAVIRHEYRTAFSGAAVEADGAQIAAIRRLPYVRAIHPDRAVQALSLPAAAPAAVISNAGSRVNSLGLPTRGEGIRVAVIDTGIDYTHPALGGGFGPGYKVAGGYDFSTATPIRSTTTATARTSPASSPPTPTPSSASPPG